MQLRQYRKSRREHNPAKPKKLAENEKSKSSETNSVLEKALSSKG